MILKTLHLKNFRKFKDTLIEFPDGVTGIIGLNGAGKSTIFEAIAWTLYGPVAARTSADTIRRETADTKEPCRVSLEFIFNNDAYYITREMTGKSLTPQATVTVNNKILAQGADTVTRFIQNQLGMDFRSFYTSIFAKQKELNALSTMNPSDRRPLILKMLGIDQLDTIVTDIRTDIRDQKNHIQQLENQTHDNQGNKKNDTYKIELQNLQKQQSTIQKTKKQHETTITTLTKQYTQLKTQTQQQKNTYEQLIKEKDTLETTKKKIDHRNQLHTQITTLDQSIRQRTQHLTTLQQDHKKLKNTTQELTTTQHHHQTLTQQYENLIKKIEHIHAQTKQHNHEITKLETKKTNIKKLGPEAHCPTCNRILGTQSTTLHTHFKDEITTHQKELATLQQKTTDLTTQKDQINRQKNALTKKITYLTQQNLETERLQTKIQSLQTEITREQQKHKTLTQEYQKLQKINFNTQRYKKIYTQINKTYDAYQKLLTQQKKRKNVLL